MIPRAYITEWQARVPWPQSFQIEQDLILARLMIEIANDGLLGNELVMRGGTCLHKLHLTQPFRYSEDLDYVRRTHSGIRPFLDALEEIAASIGLERHAVEQSGEMVHMVLDAEPTLPPGRIRIRIEANVTETKPYRDPIKVPLKVESGWWRGEAEIATFVLDELMATKLRALYQRRKGRDLFDLWLVLTERSVDDEEIVTGLRHYMEGKAFIYSSFAKNLQEKLEDEGFRNDLDELVTALPEGYNVEAAADLVMERLGARLKGAPDLAEVAGGRWRK